jgi:transposase
MQEAWPNTPQQPLIARDFAMNADAHLPDSLPPPPAATYTPTLIEGVTKVAHLPIVRHLCERIGLVQTIDAIVTSQAKVSPGLMVLAMIMDTLAGRSPLYRIHQFFDEFDVEALLGRGLAAADFKDQAVGRAMDHMAQVGPMKVFSAVAQNACKICNIIDRHVHYDTTSISVWGDYLDEPERAVDGLPGLLAIALSGPSASETPREKDKVKAGSQDYDQTPIHITHGYSKDLRPDLKQFLMESLCVAKNIPIMGGCADGNASDKTLNHTMLRRIGALMHEHGLAKGAYVYVADSALVTQENLEQLADQLFITRLPMTYDAAKEAISTAVGQGQWEQVGVLAQTEPTVNRPAAHYRLCELPIRVYERDYRAIVVHSSAHDKRRHKRLEKERQRELEQIQARLKQEEAIAYACRADALAAGERLLKEYARPGWWRLDVEFESQAKFRRGRPRQGEERAIEHLYWQVRGRTEVNQEWSQRQLEEAGCFVLLTNTPSAGEMAHNGREALEAYKDQNGIERNFAFLKDPLIVNVLFLKTPRRIQVLGMILLLSLLVYNLLEHILRQHVERTGEVLPGWPGGRQPRPTKRPTTFMMRTKFSGIMLLKIGDRRVFANPLNAVQLRWIQALGMSAADFLKVPPAYHPPQPAGKIQHDPLRRGAE